MAVNKLWILPIKVPAMNDVGKWTENLRKISALAINYVYLSLSIQDKLTLFVGIDEF